MIFRYDSIKIVRSRLNPLSDFCTWFAGLRSKGLVADLLKETHGFSDRNKIRRASNAVATHAENAVNLLGQGFSGLPDVSFLPIYYALLNIAKIYVILRDRQSELENQRWHGASYNPKSSRDLLTEEIKLYSKGAIPLYLNTITNQTFTAKRNQISIKMKDIYPFIRSISHEFSESYKREELYYPITINLEGDDKMGYRLKASITAKTHLRNLNKRYIKVLNGFNLIPKFRKKKKKTIINATGINSYATRFINDSKEKARHQLVTKYLRRYLLSAGVINNLPIAITPISDKRLIFPEELPILLAFHHMSNVVRYNPEKLEQLKDSKTWTLLLTLIRHGTLSFLELSWSAIQQKHIKIMTSINDL
jgi:hypothetical protein